MLIGLGFLLFKILVMYISGCKIFFGFLLEYLCQISEFSSQKVGKFRYEVVKLMERGCYRSALKKLWGRSKKFRAICLSFLSAVIKKETKRKLIIIVVVYVNQIQYLA